MFRRIKITPISNEKILKIIITGILSLSGVNAAESGEEANEQSSIEETISQVQTQYTPLAVDERPTNTERAERIDEQIEIIEEYVQKKEEEEEEEKKRLAIQKKREREEQRKEQERREAECEEAERVAKEERKQADKKSNEERSQADRQDKAPQQQTEVNESIHLLAQAVQAEANGEPYVGMVGVAEVILNRVNSSKFPNSVEGVIYQQGQFQVVANGTINNTPSQKAKKAVQEALNGSNRTGNALFFYNPDIATNHGQASNTVTAVIGNHVFSVN